MRAAGLVAWALLLMLIAIPALRHASAPSTEGARQVTVKPALRSAPTIARTAALVAVGFAVPTPRVVAIALAPAPARTITTEAGPPLAPLRL